MIKAKQMMEMQNQIDQVKTYFDENVGLVTISQLDNNMLCIESDEEEGMGIRISFQPDFYVVSQVVDGAVLVKEEFYSFADLVDHIENSY